MSKPNLAFIPYWQVFNSDGTPLNGGNIYTYAAGTTTPVATYPTYNDAVAGTNPNPNPIRTDSSGRPANSGNPIDIYVTQSYKIVIQTSASVSIRTVDNIPSNAQIETVQSKSANYTVAITDRDSVIEMNSSGGTVVVTLLAAATAGSGFRVKIKKMDSSTNGVTITANGSEQIDGVNSTTMINAYDYLDIISDGTQWVRTSRPTGGIIWKETTIPFSSLVTTGTVVLAKSAGTAQYKVRDIILSGAATSFSGGDRSLNVTDGTTIWSTIPANTLQFPAAYRWGASADVPFPAGAAMTTASVAGNFIYVQYSGGATDYTAGSITILIALEKVA